MKATKRIIAAVFMVMMLASVMTFPASAANSDFSSFPVANTDYANVYKPQAVAVQRFLMSYDVEFYDDLAANKGTNGYFGKATERCTKKYQALKGLSVDGRVGPATWTQIGKDLYEIGVDSVGPVYYCNGYDVLYIIRDDNNRSGYAAKKDTGGLTSIFYYI